MIDLQQREKGDGDFEPQDIAVRNARYGAVLFAVYLGLYSAFVLINTFRPALMDWVPAAGVNLAIWYGFTLIAAAFALALVYAGLCRGVRGGGSVGTARTRRGTRS